MRGLLLVLGLIALLLALLHSSWGKDLVRERAEQALGKRVRGSVSIASLDYGFLLSDIRVSGLSIADLEGKPVIEVESLDLELDRWAFLGGARTIQRLRAQQVDVHLHVDADGQSSFRKLFIPRKGKTANWIIRSLALERVRISVSTAEGATLEVKEASVEGRFAKGTSTELAVDRLQASFVAKRRDGLAIEGRIEQEGALWHREPGLTFLHVQPLETSVRVTRNDQVEETRLALQSAEFSKTPGVISAELHGAAIGPLQIGEARGKVRYDKTRLAGEQEIRLSGLKVDTQTLAALAQRELPIGDASGDISIHGLPEALIVEGSLGIPEGRIGIEGEIDARDLQAPIYDLRTTTGLEPGVLAAQPGLLSYSAALRSLAPTTVRIDLSGSGLPMRGGNFKLELQGLRGINQEKTVLLRAHQDGHSLRVDELKLDLLGTELSAVGSMQSTAQPGDVSAEIRIDGNAREVLRRLEELGLIVPTGLRLPGELNLSLGISGSFDEKVRVTIRPSTTALAGGTVDVSGSAEFEPSADGMALVAADGSMRVRSLRVQELAHMARRRVPVRGRLSGTVALRQRGQQQRITHSLSLTTPQGVQLRAQGQLRPGGWRGKLSAHAEGRELGWLSGALPLFRGEQGLRLRKRGSIELRGEVARVTLREHLHRLPEPLQTRLRESQVEAEGDLSLKLWGSPRKPRARIDLALDASARQLGEDRVHLEVGLDLEGQDDNSILLRPVGELSHSAIDGPLLSVGGSARLHEGRQPAAQRLGLDLDVELFKRSLPSLAPLRPEREELLAKLGGDLEGKIALRGRADAPELKLELLVSEVFGSSETATPLRIEATGNRQGGEASLSLGGLTLELDARREAEALALQVQTHAANVPVPSLLPRFVEMPIDAPAQLQSDLGAAIRLVDGRIESVSMRGGLELAGGEIPLPRSSRRWLNPKLSLRAQGRELRAELAMAEAHEDGQSTRTLELEAQASLDGQAGLPSSAQAEIRLGQWLLFGGTLGTVAAPRAEIDANIEVALDTSGVKPVLDVTPRTLSYSEPDREVFTHGLLDMAPGGDIVFAEAGERPVGKLSLPSAQATVPAKARPDLLVRVHIPEPIRIAKGPLNLDVRGEIEIDLAEDEGPRGQVQIEGGHLVFFGEPYAYREGQIVLNGAAPGADLLFERTLPADILRQVSTQSAGKTVRLHLKPVGGGPLIAFSGVGNSDMLEVLALAHAGHGYYFTRPDAPASTTARAPQGMQPTMIAFVHANLPRLYFLNRFAAWSQPMDAQHSYGQVRNLDAEHRFASGTTRLRFVSRPEEIGRSRAEAHLDRLLLDTESMSFGAGLRAGSRLGGGAAVFFEWASED